MVPNGDQPSYPVPALDAALCDHAGYSVSDIPHNDRHLVTARVDPSSAPVFRSNRIRETDETDCRLQTANCELRTVNWLRQPTTLLAHLDLAGDGGGDEGGTILLEYFNGAP